MYLPSLQKNLQELDRQISLLETEYEHMEMDKGESATLSKANSKAMITESSNKAYITGPSSSANTYSTRLRIVPPMPKIHPANWGHFRTASEKFSTANDEKQSTNSQKNDSNSFKILEKKGKINDSFCKETRIDLLSSGNCRNEKQKSNFSDGEYKKPCKRSMSLIQEVAESSEENGPVHAMMNNRKKCQQEQTKDQIWCELIREQNLIDEWEDKLKCLRTEVLIPQSLAEQKFSSDEENYRSRDLDEAESKSLNGKWPIEHEKEITPRGRTPNHRRLRSARTKKNCHDERFLDVIPKTLQEKEIQCALENEDWEKAEFLVNLNEFIRDMIQLVGEIKAKSFKSTEAGEESNDVLNDMHNTLMKISKIKSMNTVHNPLNFLASLYRTPLKLPEGEENFLELKKTLLGIKKFCQELTDEKSALTEELNLKNRALANYKSKEKEYLSLISSLKFNLEKMKEEVDEGSYTKRDLKILKTKLQEETKVIESLKKSHEKMQELIENYVLENDKLKAQVKITMLESQKYNVLLAGKEVEINKYKKEIQSFQRQITEQLSLLRSKATENEIERALGTISNQTNVLQTEVFSNASDTTLGKDFNENFNLATTETTSESFSTRTQPDNQNQETPTPVDPMNVEPKAVQETKSIILNDKQKTERNANVSGCATCNIIGSEPGPESERQLGLQKVLSSSKNLRSSINELLEDIRRESSENHWSNQPTSCKISSQTTLITISSEEASEGSQDD